MFDASCTACCIIGRLEYSRRLSMKSERKRNANGKNFHTAFAAPVASVSIQFPVYGAVLSSLKVAKWFHSALCDVHLV